MPDWIGTPTMQFAGSVDLFDLELRRSDLKAMIVSGNESTVADNAVSIRNAEPENAPETYLAI